MDVTRIPFCMVNLGGLSLGNRFYKHGIDARSFDQKGGTSHSVYHVHWYIYPVIYWLELLMDFLCLESASFDVAYLTELDPLWNDDETAFILNPEAVVFLAIPWRKQSVPPIVLLQALVFLLILSSGAEDARAASIRFQDPWVPMWEAYRPAC